MKVHRLRNEETKQFAITDHLGEWRRIQRHKKMALLRGSFTDEEERDKERQEAPFDHTRIRVCSSEHYVFLQEISFSSHQPKGQKFFLGKEKKTKAFSFSIKEISILLFSYLFFNSKDMTLIPGVYISTLSQ